MVEQFYIESLEFHNIKTLFYIVSLSECPVIELWTLASD